MKLRVIYKYQLMLYVFISIFAVQNYFFSEFNFSWSIYEVVVSFVFIVSVITVLGSVYLLIVESIKTLNSKGVSKKEVFYLIANIILYYAVTCSSIYLSTQIR